MSLTTIESLLEKEIGLSAEAIGSEVIAKAVRLRIADCGLPDIKAYLSHLKTSEVEKRGLIEEVIVPETWFFRNRNAFVFLANYVGEEWLPRHRGDQLRVLSVPCSTGEEPYSIAMALMNAGINQDCFHIDAVDISEKALGKAKIGTYAKGSFRGGDLSFRKRYFESKGDTYELDACVRKTVRFIKGNVLDDRLLMEQKHYDIIFCRNLLIYLSPQAKRRTIEIMDRLLAGNGILFVGHAERQAAIEWGLAGIHEFGVFACRKERRQKKDDIRPAVPVQPRPRQRLFEKAINKSGGAAPVPPAASPHKDSEAKAVSKQLDIKGSHADQKELFDAAQRLADQGSLPSALELCQTFLTEHPVHVHAHFLMGLIYEALDNEEKAEEFFNKAIYLDPNHYEALSHLSFIVEHRGDRKKAAHLRQRAHRIPRSPARF